MSNDEIDNGLKNIAGSEGDSVAQQLFGRDASGLDLENLVSRMRAIAEHVPELVKNTITVDLVSAKIPDEGIELVDMAHLALRYYVNSPESVVGDNSKVLLELESMSDQEIIENIQDFLRKNGLEGLAKNIADGNLSKEDVLNGFAEFGNALDEVVDDELAAEIVGDSIGGGDDEVLLEGLVKAEVALDRIMTDMAEKMATTLNVGHIGTFDSVANGSGVPKSDIIMGEGNPPDHNVEVITSGKPSP